MALTNTDLHGQPLYTTINDSDRIAYGAKGQSGAKNIQYSDLKDLLKDDLNADFLNDNIKGSILFNNGARYVYLEPGTAGQVLQTNGAGSNPEWVDAAGGLPSAVQGDILYYNGAAWVVLNAGTAGQILQTNGTGANPTWITNTKYYDFAVALSDETTGLTTDNDANFYVPRTCTLTEFIGYVNTAPTGAAITIDIQKNTVSIATLTIADSANSGNTTTISDTNISAGDILTFDVTQVGSTTAGAGLKIYNLAVL